MPRRSRSLIRETEVHRDVSIDDEVFQLEMEHLFGNTWVYVGHESQVPQRGDYYGTTVGTQPILMVRHSDDTVRRAAQPLPAQGHADHDRDLRQHRQVLPLSRITPGHSRTDGTLRADPARRRDTRARPSLKKAMPGTGMNPVVHVLLTTAASCSPSSTTSASELRGVLRREPSRAIRQHGGPLAGRASSRSPAACSATCTTAIGRCWSKTRPTRCHPMVAHDESSAGTAYQGVGKGNGAARREEQADGSRDLCAVRGVLTTSSRRWASASGRTGTATPACTTRSIPTTRPSRLSRQDGRGLWRAARQGAILDENRHNTRSTFPTLDGEGTDPAHPPVQADLRPTRRWWSRWTFRLVGARTSCWSAPWPYNRLINAPTSVVGHDDLEVYERAQEGLKVDANQWVNVGRLLRTGRTAPDATAETQRHHRVADAQSVPRLVEVL